MTVINTKISKKFLELAAKELKGDWVVMGGTVMVLMGVNERFTVDIDLAGPKTATQADTLKLMTIAEKIGLAPEAINQAGAFFLNRIPLMFWARGHMTLSNMPKATVAACFIAVATLTFPHLLVVKRLHEKLNWTFVRK